MSQKIRTKGKVMATVGGHLKIKQVQKRNEKHLVIGTDIAIFKGKNVLKNGFKNLNSAIVAAEKLLIA